MSTDHPITPPDELVKQWTEEYRAIVDGSMYVVDYIATQTARYRQIADAELEACCKWCADGSWTLGQELRAARRPKPPNLAEEAFELLDRIEKAESVWNMRELDTIRAALERLQELEKGNE